MLRRDLAVYLILLSGVAFTIATLWLARDAIADEMFTAALGWMR